MTGLADYVLTLPDRVDPMLTALYYLPVLQMMTYYWALAKGLNPDVPDSMRDILDAILPEGREEPELR
jgi:glucosamine 6-phosphate synthetase-like amidotransferase/phosphosugar isomerase protein